MVGRSLQEEPAKDSGNANRAFVVAEDVPSLEVRFCFQDARRSQPCWLDQIMFRTQARREHEAPRSRMSALSVLKQAADPKGFLEASG